VVETTDLAEAWAAFRAAKCTHQVNRFAVTQTRHQLMEMARSGFATGKGRVTVDMITTYYVLDPNYIAAVEAKQASEDAVWEAIAVLEQVWIKHGLCGQNLSATSEE
jgi:hypothetical protein